MKFLIILLFLSSCVFQAFDRENKIQDVQVVMQKQDEALFMIKKNLEQKFNLQNTEAPTYTLVILKTEVLTGGGVNSAGVSSNFTLTITINFSLIDNKTGKIIFKSSVAETTNMLSSTGNLIAEYSNKKFATQALTKTLSERIYEEVQDTFAF
jgi:hypothetical protein